LNFVCSNKGVCDFFSSVNQVKTRCKSEWAEFQARLTNADKMYLKGLGRFVRG